MDEMHNLDNDQQHGTMKGDQGDNGEELGLEA
jgi:hypothetical protein